MLSQRRRARSTPKAFSSGGISQDQPSNAWPPLRPEAAQATLLASSTTTRLPARAKRSAVCRPLKPAPIINTSVSKAPCRAGRSGIVVG